MKDNKKGFTLVELLAVIVILAIILIIVVPKIMGVINSSRESARNSTKEIYYKAVKKALLVKQTKDEAFEDGLYTLNKSNKNQICHNTSCLDIDVDVDDENAADSLTVTIENWKIKAGTFRIKLTGEKEVTVFLEDGTSKKSSSVNEDYLVAVEEAIVAYNSGSPSVSPDGDYYVDDEGNLISVLTGEEARINPESDASLLSRNKKITVNSANGFPKNAFIKISDSKIVASQFSDEDPICRFIPDDRVYKRSTDGKKITNIRTGAKYRCKVNDTESLDFYILINNDTETNGNDNFDLFLDVSLLTDDYKSAWGTTSDKTPTLLYTKLYELTKDWTNIPYVEFNEDFYEPFWASYSKNIAYYGGLTIENGVVTIGTSDFKYNNKVVQFRARIISSKDLQYVGGSTKATCFDWVVNNGTEKNKNIWTQSATSTLKPYYIDYSTQLLKSESNLSAEYYVLPLISVPKTAMDWGNNIIE